ncbi:MAG: MBL fold metallo-hydrolase [Candidatus Omnitrophota bacterium]
MKINNLLIIFCFLVLVMGGSIDAMEQPFPAETIPTHAGPLNITFFGHGSLMFTFNKLMIQVDPYSAVADYSKLPPADLILITHEHQDHLDPGALSQIRTAKTQLVLTAACAEKVSGGKVMANGESQTIDGIKIEAVPAYNIEHKRADGTPFHPKGRGNGYVLTFGNKRVYVAGDTENIPEMKQLKDIDVAFLPMNLPYTMTPDMVAEAAKMIKPRVLYVYHFNPEVTDFFTRLSNLMKGVGGVELRLPNKK